MFWVLLFESLLQGPGLVVAPAQVISFLKLVVFAQGLGESQRVALILTIRRRVLFPTLQLTEQFLDADGLQAPLTHSHPPCQPLTHSESRSGYHVPAGTMEQLQTFDDDIVNLILSYSLLDLSAPERLTADEVYAAAELAVQISTLEGAGLAARRPLPGATAPAPARNPPARETQAPARRQEAAATRGGVIGADERREILVDSDDSETETEAEGEVCIACAGGAGEKRRLACECNYCAPCLRRCIRTGLRNEESWPPRCHERLTEQDIRWTRRPGLLRLWSQLAVEWDSPAPARVYCSRSECAASIPRAGGEAGEVRCGACGEGTCGGCRRPWHPGLPCAEEEEEEELMDMMDEYGYASCNNCRRIVDLRDGCNHMT